MSNHAERRKRHQEVTSHVALADDQEFTVRFEAINGWQRFADERSAPFIVPYLIEAVRQALRDYANEFDGIDDDVAPAHDSDVVEDVPTPIPAALVEVEPIDSTVVLFEKAKTTP
jgi:hypothetical protein